MTQRFTYDLVDEPWIPCIHADGTVVDLSIRQVLNEAPDLREISDPSPLVTAALHRLLLAILHRTHGPATMREWAEIWEAGAFDTAKLDTYLDGQRDRFDLFHPERPFYQTTEVHEEYADPIALLSHELLLGRPLTLFQQANPELVFSPAQAARAVVAFQAFAAVNTIPSQVRHGEPKGEYGSAKDGPLKKPAVVIFRGPNLFKTLMLNLHRYAGKQRAPWDFEPADDRPAWERETPALPITRTPSGYLDLLTWQSRRIRLFPTKDGGNTVIASAVVMKGHSFPNEWPENRAETMVMYREIPSAKAGDAKSWTMVSFDRRRAFWRDGLSIYRSLPDQPARTKMADWLDDLTVSGYLNADQTFSAEVFGLATNQAKIELWRHERYPLPLALLINADLAVFVFEALQAAESAAQLLKADPNRGQQTKHAPFDNRRPLQVFADELLGQGSRSIVKHDGRSVTRSEALVVSRQPEVAFWPRLEAPFRDFIVTLPTEREGALDAWINRVEETARVAFEETMRSFDTSARALKAEALASRRFRRALAEALAPYRDTVRQLAADAAS